MMDGVVQQNMCLFIIPREFLVQNFPNLKFSGGTNTLCANNMTNEFPNSLRLTIGHQKDILHDYKFGNLVLLIEEKISLVEESENSRNLNYMV